jgi:putative oxidoreductase
MLDGRTASLGALVPRSPLGVMNFAHSLTLRYLELSMPGSAESIRSIGYLGWSGYATFVSELAAGALRLLGGWSRVVALALIPVLIGVLIARAGYGSALASANGWECLVFLIAVSTMVALFGDSAFALKPIPQRRTRARFG